ncbi:hypothetical protein J5N97_022807 [Dioscorea zingiberensis]|uniref:Uncharacterized protein n=1 Tax=Dioscorea zingiberensis TaxID=325984 RepID=A0A9D5HB91_9LILI|nr:hypothetical protein J5N97_022807 [Dioscorea zingiberensis]
MTIELSSADLFYYQNENEMFIERKREGRRRGQRSSPAIGGQRRSSCGTEYRCRFSRGKPEIAGTPYRDRHLVQSLATGWIRFWPNSGRSEVHEGISGGSLVFRCEMVNRAVHAAARGGNSKILMELLNDYFDVLVYRGNQGSTILHAASRRGQRQSREHNIACRCFPGSLSNREGFGRYFSIIVMFYKRAGDTFLHMAVAGFRTSDFRRLDRQMELMKQLISRNIVDVRKIIIVGNHEGRTVVHTAVIDNVHSNLIELMMSGATQELLLEFLMLRYSCSSASKPEITQCETVDENDVPSDHKNNLNSINNVARRLKILLRLPRHQEKKAETILKKVEDDDSVDSFKSSKKLCEHEDTPTPLWQQFTKGTSLMNNKQTLSVRNSIPSPTTKKKFVVGLMHGVIQAMPHLAPPTRSTVKSFSKIISDTYIR